MPFQVRHLAVAIAMLSFAGLAHSAGLDRSTQPSWGFAQDGTFAYVEYITIDPKVAGKDTSNNAVPDMAESYEFLNFGAKADINDTFTLGAFFDQPLGADVQYSGSHNFTVPSDVTKINQVISQAQQNILAAKTANDKVAEAKATQTLLSARTALQTMGESTSVTVKSQNFTALLGAKFGDKKQFQVFAGPALQKISGDVHLRGLSYGPFSGYDATISEDTAYGWVAGVAYSKPEIALKASLTYRSEIEHTTKMAERLPVAPMLNSSLGTNFPNTLTEELNLESPKSVNLDFQTGINPTTLLTAKVRWVPWSDFAVVPKLYNKVSKIAVPEGLPLITYDKDSWTAEIGLGKKLSDKWAVSGAVGWDSGAGNPVTTLGPVEGNWNVGLGARYNVTPEWAVSAGAKYLKFGDAKAKLPNGTVVGDFTDNDGWVYGLRLSYQKK